MEAKQEPEDPRIEEGRKKVVAILRRIGRGLIVAFWMIAPKALIGACYAIAFAGAAYAMITVFFAFGASLDAAIPAAAVGLLPAAWALRNNLDLAGWIAAGCIAAGAAALIEAIGPLYRAMVVPGMIGLIFLMDVHEGKRDRRRRRLEGLETNGRIPRIDLVDDLADGGLDGFDDEGVLMD